MVAVLRARVIGAATGRRDMQGSLAVLAFRGRSDDRNVRPSSV
jgi:hypothetical protein